MDKQNQLDAKHGEQNRKQKRAKTGTKKDVKRERQAPVPDHPPISEIKPCQVGPSRARPAKKNCHWPKGCTVRGLSWSPVLVPPWDFQRLGWSLNILYIVYKCSRYHLRFFPLFVIDSSICIRYQLASDWAEWVGHTRSYRPVYPPAEMDAEDLSLSTRHRITPRTSSDRFPIQALATPQTALDFEKQSIG